MSSNEDISKALQSFQLTLKLLEMQSLALASLLMQDVLSSYLSMTPEERLVLIGRTYKVKKQLGFLLKRHF